jgi:hypothetical protein
MNRMKMNSVQTGKTPPSLCDSESGPAPSRYVVSKMCSSVSARFTGVNFAMSSCVSMSGASPAQTTHAVKSGKKGR